MPRIVIAESDANKVGKVVLIAGLLIVLVLIGRAATPVDKNGSLMFLSPRVAQIARYQRQAEKWAVEMRSLEISMQTLLDGNTSDLFAQDSAFQDINKRTENLVTSIDATGAPDSLGGLRDLLSEAAVAHQDAATALGQWISEPSNDTKTAAEDAFSSAASLLDRIYNNPWVIIEQAAESSNDR